VPAGRVDTVAEVLSLGADVFDVDLDGRCIITAILQGWGWGLGSGLGSGLWLGLGLGIGLGVGLELGLGLGLGLDLGLALELGLRLRLRRKHAPHVPAGRVDTVAEVLSLGADVFDVDLDGRCALWWAIALGHANVAALLLDCSPLAPPPLDETGLSCASLALRRGHDAVLVALFDRAAATDTGVGVLVARGLLCQVGHIYICICTYIYIYIYVCVSIRIYIYIRRCAGCALGPGELIREG